MLKKLLFIFLGLFLLLLLLLITCKNQTATKIEEPIAKIEILTKLQFYEEETVKNNLIINSVDLCCKKFNLKPELIVSIIFHESKFDVEATNTSNDNGTVDHGLMQLNSGTFPYLTIDQLYDIETNIFNGSKLLSELLNYYKGNELKAVSAYNCGKWRVNNEQILNKTLEYTNKVLKYSYKLELAYEKYLNKKGGDQYGR